MCWPRRGVAEIASGLVCLVFVAGVAADGGIDLSEVGGDGGVCVSEAADETDFAGGVAIVGEDTEVLVGECSDTDDSGRATVAARGVGF